MGVMRRLGVLTVTAAAVVAASPIAVATPAGGPHKTHAYSGSTRVHMEWVTVGDPGNKPDTEVMVSDRTSGYGSVPYRYRIGKYDVTNAQYAKFLNAVASKADPHLLFFPCMDRSQCYHEGSGIARSGRPGSYH
jgi:hypothetical protein